MQLQNFSKLQAAYTMGLQKDGRQCIVVIAKGSWEIPQSLDEAPRLITHNPLPIFEVDEFFGEPGESAQKHEYDFARFKPACDVVMNASAYADYGFQEKVVDVNLRIDDKIDKSIRVHGPRVWRSDLGLVSIDEADYFERQEIHYGLTYGGVDKTWEADGQTATYLANPVGIGYQPNAPRKAFVGQPAPQLESLKHRISGVNDNAPPMSFGVISKNFPERLKYAGTYDDHWLKNVRPLLPDDFDERFYQCAPPDQRMPYIRGNEVVTLTHLSARDAVVQFKLPRYKLFMSHMKGGLNEIEIEARADTLIIEPDENRFSIVWRGNIPIQNTIHEIGDVIVGEPTKAYYRAKIMGKKFAINKGRRTW